MGVGEGAEGFGGADGGLWGCWGGAVGGGGDVGDGLGVVSGVVVVMVVVVIGGGGGARLKDGPVGDGEGGVGVVGAWEGGPGGGLGVVPLFEDHGLVAGAGREHVAGGAALGVLVRGRGGEEDGQGRAPVAAFGAKRLFLRLRVGICG